MTPERIRTALSARREFVRETEDGATGQHEGRMYEVSLVNSDVVVRQALPRIISHDSRRALVQLLNDWNRDRILPTLQLSEHTEGVGVVSTLSVSAAAGLSREQLAEVIDLGVVLGRGALDAAQASIPQPSGNAD
ncbi:YbjN domain-containing protein [Salana multivorans]